MNLFNLLLEKQLEDKFTSAVAAVEYKHKWLLGLSTANDDRKNKWAMPGGHIKNNENIKKAAERECWEETGIKVKAYSTHDYFKYKKEGVAFVHCKPTSSNIRFDNNNEFSALGFFSIKEMKSLKLYDNVLDIINKIKKL